MKKMKNSDDKSEWWAVDGEMHEIGDNVPLRERFIIPRDNIPNKRRKQLREQFMRRTRLVLKESVSTTPFSLSLSLVSIFSVLFGGWESVGKWKKMKIICFSFTDSLKV